MIEFEDFDMHQKNLINVIKVLLYKRVPDIFDRIDFNLDSIYHEPLLLYYLKQNDDIWLDSILYGYETKKKERILVFSDKDGWIYLPNFGYLGTNYPNQSITLITQGEEITLAIGNKNIPFSYEPLLVIEPEIVVIKHCHPLMLIAFLQQGNKPDVLIEKNPEIHYISNINKSLELIKNTSPEFYLILKRCLRNILLFSSRQQNSFTLMAMQNMIFLNVQPLDSEVSLIEQISHEVSHIIYFIITHNSKYNLFNCDINTPLEKIVGIQLADRSSIYLKFHGLYTYVGITKNLFRCIERGNLSSRLIHEAKGRFVFCMLKFLITIEEFKRFNVLKTEGEKWFNYFIAEFESLKNEFNDMSGNYKFLTQSDYCFNTKYFESENPI